MTRGVIYMKWKGYEPKVDTALSRSIASLNAVHPELPYKVFALPDGATLLEKAQMFDLSPFDETLYLDADTVVMGRLDYGFAKAAHHRIAVCLCECPWARRYGGLKDAGDMVEFNTGVIFFKKTASVLFDSWKRHIEIDSSVRFLSKDGIKTMSLNDQASFALAVEQTGFNPWVLPMNWNFRSTWQKTVFGEIRIWHSYDEVPRTLTGWNAQQSQPDAVIGCAKIS